MDNDTIVAVVAMALLSGTITIGVVVTNIDNGFGAGVFAARVARRAARAPTPETGPEQP